MNLVLKEIDEKNYEEILNLKVSKEQEGFIESTKKCLEEASELDLWRTVAICNEDVTIGFAMYGLFLDEGENGRVWLDRLMIDYRYQGKGYGRKSIDVLLKQLYREYSYNNVYLSVYEDNSNAINLYERLGFKFNGELDINGEKVMKIDLKDMEI